MEQLGARRPRQAALVRLCDSRRGTAVYFAGNTGADVPMFIEIRARLGAPDLALIPIGGYEPRWFMAPHHCNPAEAAEIHQTLAAKRSLGMDWGTFQLTDEARDAPPLELAAAVQSAGLSAGAFTAPPAGASITL